MTQPDAATILSPSGKRDLVKAAIIEHTRAKVFVERNDFHQVRSAAAAPWSPAGAGNGATRLVRP